MCEGKYFNTSIIKINCCVVHSWKNYMYRNNLTIYSALDNDVTKTTSENNGFRLFAIYIANSRYLEYYRQKEYRVLFKYIRYSLKLMNWYAVYYRFFSKLELRFCGWVFLWGNLRPTSKLNTTREKRISALFLLYPLYSYNPQIRRKPLNSSSISVYRSHMYRRISYFFALVGRQEIINFYAVFRLKYCNFI